jgi:hypothetical protein
MLKQKNKKFSWSNFKNYIILSAFILLLVKCGFDIYDGHKMRESLKYKPKKNIAAIVIDERHSFRRMESTYTYKFYVNNIEYRGACNNDTYNPGDSIKIEYVIENPKYNCPLGIY